MTSWTFLNLVDSLQTVRKELEVLRGEHENIITSSELKDTEGRLIIIII